MKHIFLFLCLFFSSYASAQISIDKVENDGSRIIVSRYYTLYIEFMDEASFRLGYITSNDVEEYYLTINLPGGQISKDRKLLIKLDNGSTMELHNTDDAYYDYQRGIVRPNYSLTIDEIKRIIEGQVVKIRIETDLDKIDKNIKKNRFSKGLKEAFEAIQKQKQTKNDLYEGF